MKTLSLILVLLFIILSCTKKAEIPIYSYKVINSYPHDNYAFTEGLTYKDGFIYEGTGIPGHSTLRKINFKTGEIQLNIKLEDKYFGEGITIFKDKIAFITESSRIGFVYSLDSLQLIKEFEYPTKGWGITWDKKFLIMSDGSDKLYYLDPDSFEKVRELQVTDNGKPVNNINEMEYIKDEIWANIWPTDRVVRISPKNGKVVGWIDFKALLSEEDKNQIGWSLIEGVQKPSIPMNQEACLNGIAYDSINNRIFVTGKLWPKMFEVKIISD